MGGVLHLFPSGLGSLRRGFSGVFGGAPGGFTRIFSVLTGLLHVILGGLSEHECGARER